jgi:hypothetical protein
MTNIHVPSTGPESWRRLLGDPERHWVRGRSAWELAHSWESADSIPAPVVRVLDAGDEPSLHDLEIVAAFPEHQTPLPGGSRPTQTNLLVFARSHARGDPVVLGVERKVDEPFGPLVHEWDPSASPGKTRRLDFLCARLGLDPAIVGDLRYQLLHRTVGAILEAERFGATTAALVVHSFSDGDAGFSDYAAFLARLGAPAATAGSTTRLATPGPIRMLAAWVPDTVAP